MSTSLITGGAGMVGRELARLLLARGERVLILDTAPIERLPDDIRDRVTLVHTDLSDRSLVMEATEAVRPDTIYHLGALMPPASEQNHVAAWGINTTGTLHVLESARLFDVPTVVYSSTTATFSTSLPDPVPNNHTQHPVTMYGLTKVCSERLGEHFHRLCGLDFRAVRFLAVLGPGRIRGSGWSAYTSLVIEECARGNPYVIQVNESLRLRFIYVKDAARSLMQLADADGSKLTTRVYNLDGFSASTRELVDAVIDNVPDARISWEFNREYQHVMDTQYGNIQHKMDDRLAREEWGWKPAYTLNEAVRDFVADVRQGQQSRTKEAQ